MGHPVWIQHASHPQQWKKVVIGCHCCVQLTQKKHLFAFRKSVGIGAGNQVLKWNVSVSIHSLCTSIAGSIAKCPVSVATKLSLHRSDVHESFNCCKWGHNGSKPMFLHLFESDDMSNRGTKSNEDMKLNTSKFTKKTNPSLVFSLWISQSDCQGGSKISTIPPFHLFAPFWTQGVKEFKKGIATKSRA